MGVSKSWLGVTSSSIIVDGLGVNFGVTDGVSDAVGVTDAPGYVWQGCPHQLACFVCREQWHAF